MLAKLHDLLCRLEEQVNPAQQQRAVECHRKALEWEETVRLPLIISYPFPEENSFYPYPHREVFDNPEKMLFNELLSAFDTSIYLHPQVKDDLIYTVRPNFGTVLVAAMLGGRAEQRDDSPPWIRHFETEEEFLTIFNGQGRSIEKVIERVANVYHIYHQVLSGFPRLRSCLNIVMPDLQGPLDTLELLRGSEVYLDLVLNPGLPERAMNVITEAQIKIFNRLKPLLTDFYPEYTFQHNTMIKGGILLRNDSAIMIDSEMYCAQIAPFDERILQTAGSGGIHSCGKIDHNMSAMLQLPSIACFDLGQSYLNDMKEMYILARNKKIPITRVRPSREFLLSDELRKQYPTGVSLVYDAASFEEACQVSKLYNNKYGNN